MGGTARRAATATLVAVAIIVAALALWKLRVVLALLFLGFVVASAMRPSVEWLNRRAGVPKSVGVIVHYLGFLAVIAVVAVTRWDRTHLVVTASAFVVEHGFLRRGSASISLNGTVFEVERPLLGRILGYGTVVAGELEIDCVPRRLTRVLQQRKLR